jgi:phage shock protein C
MAVYCTQCGSQLPLGARFCSNCGVAIGAGPWSPTRPLLRPRTGRQLGGVCQALATAYGWDVTAVRIVAVVLLLATSGLLGVAYIAAWIGIPEEPAVVPPSAPGVYPPGV